MHTVHPMKYAFAFCCFRRCEAHTDFTPKYLGLLHQHRDSHATVILVANRPQRIRNISENGIRNDIRINTQFDAGKMCGVFYNIWVNLLPMIFEFHFCIGLRYLFILIRTCIIFPKRTVWFYQALKRNVRICMEVECLCEMSTKFRGFGEYAHRYICHKQSCLPRHLFSKDDNISYCWYPGTTYRPYFTKK